MVALLRRCIASWRWRVMVAVGWAAFIGLTVWLGPFIRLWSLGVRGVVLGLVGMGLSVAGLILGHAFPALLMYLLLGKELNRRTPKAKDGDSRDTCQNRTQRCDLHQKTSHRSSANAHPASNFGPTEPPGEQGPHFWRLLRHRLWSPQDSPGRTGLS